MVLILVESSDALAIDHKALKRFLGALVGKLDGLIPYPEALCAWINGWTDSKA